MSRIPDNIPQFDIFVGPDGVLRAVPENDAAESARKEWIAEGSSGARLCAVIRIPMAERKRAAEDRKKEEQ